jgi:hypothetical protein
MSYQYHQSQYSPYPPSRHSSGRGRGGSYFPEYPPDSRNQFPSSNPPPTYYHGGDYSEPPPSRGGYQGGRSGGYGQHPHQYSAPSDYQSPWTQNDSDYSDWNQHYPYPPSASSASASQPPLVYEVRFKCTKDSYRLDSSCHEEIQIHDTVIVETDRGYDAGVVLSISPADIPMASMYTNTFTTLRCIVARASDDDLFKIEENHQEEERALQLCRHLTLMRHLPIVVAATEMQFDRRKLTIIFSAERRVDFRELVRDMFQMFKTRIWMQKVSSTEATALSILFPTSPLPPQGMTMIYPQTRSLVALPNLSTVQAVAAAAAAERAATERGVVMNSEHDVGVGVGLGSGEPLDAYPTYEHHSHLSVDEVPPPSRRSQHRNPHSGRDPYHSGAEDYLGASHHSSSYPSPGSGGGGHSSPLSGGTSVGVGRSSPLQEELQQLHHDHSYSSSASRGDYHQGGGGGEQYSSSVDYSTTSYPPMPPTKIHSRQSPPSPERHLQHAADALDPSGELEDVREEGYGRY